MSVKIVKILVIMVIMVIVRILVTVIGYHNDFVDHVDLGNDEK